MTLHRKEQNCNVTSEFLEQIAQFGSHLCGMSHQITVEPLYNGHVGVGEFVRYKEVSFIGRLVQECICNPYRAIPF